MDDTTTEPVGPDFIAMTAGLVSAYVAHNHVPVAELARLIATTHAGLAGITPSSVRAEATPERPTPAQIRTSITHEALISFEDGKPYKALRRHLRLRGLTPEAYRAKWALPVDYPMTAAGFSEMRSAVAKGIGLGVRGARAGRQAASEAAAAPADEPQRAGRPRKVAQTR